MSSTNGWAFEPTGTNATGARSHRPAPRKRHAGAIVGAAITAILAGTLVPGAPAYALTPPAAPNNITIFPSRDFVANDYPGRDGQLATVTVTRAGVVTGSAVGPIAGGLLEVNHPGGVCWGTNPAVVAPATPDIQPGDVVTTSFPDGTTDTAVTENPAVTSFSQPTPNQIVILGTLAALGGTVADPAMMEQRIVQADLITTSVAKRDVRAVPGPLTPDPTGSYSSSLTFTATTFTASYVFASAATASIAAAGEMRALSWMAVDAAANRQGMTIAEFGVLGGPGLGGCPLNTPGAVAPSVPGIGIATGGDASALVSWMRPIQGSSAITGYSIQVLDAGGNQFGLLQAAPESGLASGLQSSTVTGLTNGQNYHFQVQATNAVGLSGFSFPSNIVTPRTTPGAPLMGAARVGNASALVRWTAPANAATSAITGYSVQVLNNRNLQVGALRPAAAGATAMNVTGLINGTGYRFRVLAANAGLVAGAFSAASNLVTPRTTPGAAVIRIARSGLVGGTLTARANWSAPRTNGGAVINGYVVTALRMSANGRILSRITSRPQSAGVRTLSMRLPKGRYRFVIRARNVAGLSSFSARSNLVAAR